MPAKRKADDKAEAAEVPKKEKETKKKVAKEPEEATPAVAAKETKENDNGPAIAQFHSLLQQVPETKEACGAWFRTCADGLMNNFELVVAGSKIFRFCEIEFYYNDHNVHQDTFIHGSDMQFKTACHWYFHTAGPSGAYKGGSFKGLDLTFGVPNKIPGGILLRSMEEVANGEVVEGPCMLVDRLLKENQKAAIVDLVKTGFSLRATDVNPYMYIRPSKSLGRVLVGSPRVGLTLKKHDAFKETFVMMPYRMTSLTSQIKKQRQTIIIALHSQGRSTSEIMALTSAKKGNVEENSKAADAAAGAKKVPGDFKGEELKTEGLISLFAACQRAGNV